MVTELWWWYYSVQSALSYGKLEEILIENTWDSTQLYFGCQGTVTYWQILTVSNTVLKDHLKKDGFQNSTQKYLTSYPSIGIYNMHIKWKL